jgi:hypothetical protein
MEGKRNGLALKMKERGLQLLSLDAWDGGEALGARLAGGGRTRWMRGMAVNRWMAD